MYSSPPQTLCPQTSSNLCGIVTYIVVIQLEHHLWHLICSLHTLEPSVNASCVPGTILGLGDIETNKHMSALLCLEGKQTRKYHLVVTAFKNPGDLVLAWLVGHCYGRGGLSEDVVFNLGFDRREISLQKMQPKYSPDSKLGKGPGVGRSLC